MATSSGVTGADTAYAAWKTLGSQTISSAPAEDSGPSRTTSWGCPTGVRANRVTAGATRW